MQPERRQVLKQLAAQVVHHALTGIDLHLRAVGGDQLVHDLQHDAGDDDRGEQDETMVLGDQGDPWRQARRKRPSAQHVVDDDRERPRLQRAEPDFRQEQHRQQRDALAVRPQERQRPDEERFAHPPTFRGGSSGCFGTRFGAIRGMINGTTRSWLESATYRKPRRGS